MFNTTAVEFSEHTLTHSPFPKTSSTLSQHRRSPNFRRKGFDIYRGVYYLNYASNDLPKPPFRRRKILLAINSQEVLKYCRGNFAANTLC